MNLMYDPMNKAARGHGTMLLTSRKIGVCVRDSFL